MKNKNKKMTKEEATAAVKDEEKGEDKVEEEQEEEATEEGEK